MTKIQYYKAPITTTRPSGEADLFHVLERIKRPKNENIYNQIHEAEQHGDMETKAHLKTQLYFLTPCIYSDGQGRAYKNIARFTGLMALDFDHIENAAEFRDDLFNEYQFIIAAWLSASKQGVKALVSIPVCENVDEFQSLFWGLASREMMQFEGFDKAPQNPVLPLFVSYDKDIKIRRDYTQWNIKGENPSKLYPETTIYKYEPKENVEGLKRWLIEETYSRITSIATNGHPQLRAWAYSLGGYVSGGVIDKLEAESVLFDAVSKSGYLKKGVKGYQKTAKEMLIKGMNEPIIVQ